MPRFCAKLEKRRPASRLFTKFAKIHACGNISTPKNSQAAAYCGVGTFCLQERIKRQEEIFCMRDLALSVNNTSSL